MHFNEPYTDTDPQAIRDDAQHLFMGIEHEQLANLISTYFTSDQLRELIDDRMMGRV